MVDLLLHGQSTELNVNEEFNQESNQAEEHQESWDQERRLAAKYDHGDKVGKHVQDDAQQKADTGGTKESLLVTVYEGSHSQAGGSKVPQDQEFHNDELKIGKESLDCFVCEDPPSPQIRPKNEARKAGSLENVRDAVAHSDGLLLLLQPLNRLGLKQKGMDVFPFLPCEIHSSENHMKM